MQGAGSSSEDQVQLAGGQAEVNGSSWGEEVAACSW
jgi:hypothetical protein